MRFEEKLTDLIQHLEFTAEQPKDIALKRVVEILKGTKTEKEVRKNANLINRISIDSVKDWTAIERISCFFKLVA